MQQVHVEVHADHDHDNSNAMLLGMQAATKRQTLRGGKRRMAEA
jgi:hypothetical protein